jgi:hypothetical protein
MTVTMVHRSPSRNLSKIVAATGRRLALHARLGPEHEAVEELRVDRAPEPDAARERRAAADREQREGDGVAADALAEREEQVLDDALLAAAHGAVDRRGPPARRRHGE